MGVLLFVVSFMYPGISKVIEVKKNVMEMPNTFIWVPIYCISITVSLRSSSDCSSLMCLLSETLISSSVGIIVPTYFAIVSWCNFPF